MSKGERVRSRYKFEDYGNSAIRAATRVTSFPPDYLADGAARAEDCVGNAYPSTPLAGEHVAENIDPPAPFRAAFSPRAAFNKRITLAPVKRSHF